jgi:hypothetical protein
MTASRLQPNTSVPQPPGPDDDPRTWRRLERGPKGAQPVRAAVILHLSEEHLRWLDQRAAANGTTLEQEAHHAFVQGLRLAYEEHPAAGDREQASTGPSASKHT